MTRTNTQNGSEGVRTQTYDADGRLIKTVSRAELLGRVRHWVALLLRVGLLLR